MPVQAEDLRALVDRLADLADRWLAVGPGSAIATTRATQLRDHVRGHLAPRAASLDAPILILLLGPTGAGKSTIFNTIVGRAVSETGVLRPTTRHAVVLADPHDRDGLVSGALAGVPPERLRFAADASAEPGVVVVDAPDIDSIEHENRELADHLVESADLAIFVTTATRYADQVPWRVLERVRERGLPLIVIVNRLPGDPDGRALVLDDVRRLVAEAGFVPSPLIVGVDEGRLAGDGGAVERDAIEPVLDRVRTLREDREARRELATRALAGAVAGIGELVDRVADDVAHAAIDVGSLTRTARDAYDRELASLRDALRAGTFLRDEALRHWQAYVGADDITRFFSRGIGAIRGAIVSFVRPSTAPVGEVRRATAEDIVAVARTHANEAARRTATTWSDEPRVATIVADRADLWASSADFEGRLRGRIDDWIASIVADIAATGEGKRKLARGASIGVNAIGVGVMLASFIHTAGLTGTEVGIAAGTAFLNQKLLSAFFGEAAMVELVGRARRRLEEALAATFDEERQRFDDLVPSAPRLEELVTELRSAADASRRLPTVPVDR
jgi:energy-coupling factor transporter ATP-binding protein EcfA2